MVQYNQSFLHKPTWLSFSTLFRHLTYVLHLQTKYVSATFFQLNRLYMHKDKVNLGPVFYVKWALLILRRYTHDLIQPCTYIIFTFDFWIQGVLGYKWSDLVPQGSIQGILQRQQLPRIDASDTESKPFCLRTPWIYRSDVIMMGSNVLQQTQDRTGL